jgi:hypothetical protein
MFGACHVGHKERLFCTIFLHTQRAFGRATTATQRTESTSDDSVNDCGWLPWPKEQANDTDDQSFGEEDECGWLPWPLEEDN